LKSIEKDKKLSENYNMWQMAEADRNKVTGEIMKDRIDYLSPDHQ